MTPTFFHVVSQDVARNPVSKAVQRTKLNQALRDFQITLYHLEDGSQQADNLMAAAQVLAVATRLHEVRDLEPHEINVVRGALSAVTAASERGFQWRHADAPAIDAGMARAASIILAAPQIEVQRAWKFVSELEAA